VGVACLFLLGFLAAAPVSASKLHVRDSSGDVDPADTDSQPEDSAGPLTASHVWLVATSDGTDESGRVVHVQIPLEWLRKGGHFRCGGPEDDPESQVDGLKLYREFRDLPVGEEREVRKLRCDDSRMVLRVVSRAPEEGRRASKLHIRVREDGDDGDNVDLEFSLSTLQSLGSMIGSIFNGHWLRLERNGDSDALMEDFPGKWEILRRLPPFEMVRVEDKGDRVKIWTE
jgi:hypothetical protein